MGSLRTLLAALLLPLATGQALALETRLAPEDPTRQFATCAGRLYALLEYQWTTDPDAADATAESRARMVELIAATARPGDPAPLNWQIEARAAQARLLALSDQAKDPRLRAHAKRRAMAETAACHALLLD